MDIPDFTTYLLKLPQECREFLSDHVLCFTLPRTIHHCPYCDSTHTTVNCYRNQTLHGIIGSDLTYVYRCRRYRCQDCGKTFAEERPFIERYQRMPKSVIATIVKEHGELVTEDQIARRHGVSAPTVMRHFAKAMAEVEENSKGALPKILSMDEFRGNVGAKFQVVLNDLENKQCHDVLKDRAKEELYTSVQSYPEKERQEVELVSMDLCNYFRHIVETSFPNADIAADKFHAVRLANDALNEIRIDLQEEMTATERKHFKNSRKLLLARRHHLSESALCKLEAMLGKSKTLKDAYWLKEEYFTLFTSEDRGTFQERLKSFAAHVENCGLKPFRRLLRTTEEWKEEIWLGIETGFNNGFTEGCNNTIKVLKRISYGFRNFDNYRRRILFVLNNPDRQARRSKILKKVIHNI